MAALLSAAAWLCSAALGGVAVETAARLAVRGRQVRVEGGSARGTGDLEAIPRIALLLHGGADVTLVYAPRLTVPMEPPARTREQGGGSGLRDRAELLHQAEIAVERAATANLALRLRADGASGRVDLRRSEVYADEALPAGERLAWRSARAALEATATPVRRVTLTGLLLAFETGGADDEARHVVPLQRGTRLGAAVRYGASRRDELSLVVDASRSRFRGATDVPRAAIVRLGGGWARSLGPALAARLASGAAWSTIDASLGGGARELTAFAEAGLAHAPARPAVSTDLAFRLTPYLNPFTGGVDQRLEASATARWRAAGEWELTARAAAAATRGDTSRGAYWTGERRAEVGSLDLRASWTFARRGTLSFGPRLRGQRSHDRALPTFFEWGAALELAVGARWAG